MQSCDLQQPPQHLQQPKRCQLAVLLKSKRNVVVEVNKDFKDKLEELKMAVEEKRYSNVNRSA